MTLGRWLVLLALAPATAGAADLRGTLTLYVGGQALRAAEAADAVIYFRPRVPAKRAPAAEPAIMSTSRKQFVPRVLPITVGSSVRFPNQDPILHNAFSTQPENAFDTGQYGTGPGSTHTFSKPGLVKIYCNVHHAMFGFLLVLDTPYFTRPGLDGRFELTGLPEVEGDLVVFHDRATPLRERLVPAPIAPELALRLDLNKRKVPQHMNKFGKPYRRNPAGAY